MSDPLAETGYSLRVTSPHGNGFGDEGKIAGLHVRITIAYSSGGGPESAYVLNDTVSFVVTPDRITSVTFERDAMPADRPDIDLREGCPEEFLAEIRRFCESVLPPELSFDPPPKG